MMQYVTVRNDLVEFTFLYLMKMMKSYMVSSMMALTMSLLLFLSALMALDLETLAWETTFFWGLATRTFLRVGKATIAFLNVPKAHVSYLPCQTFG